ncbi:MAG: hypothetical protein J6L02_03185 [Bacteroidales bacterium]|nr:hypothetical protein [Bacteroidales bacterium]
MKLNFKKSILSIFSSEQNPNNDIKNDSPKKRKIEFENEDFDKAIESCDIPNSILEVIATIVNKPLPEVILKTIDLEAEKSEIRESLYPIFSSYIKYLLTKAENSNGAPLFVEGDDNVELVVELEEKLKLASQREEDYKNRYLSAERQKRALNDKVRDLEEKTNKQEKDLSKSENARIEANNNVRQLSKKNSQLEDSVEQLKLEIDHYKQLELTSNMMGMTEGFSEGEFIESLKNKIIMLETANGEMEEKLIAEEEHLKEVVESFETALHVKEETVMQAVEREKVLQARIDSLQSEMEEKSLVEGGDEALTARLIDITRKYQSLQSELSKYKNQIYEESEGEMKKRIDQLTADLSLANAKLEELQNKNTFPADNLASQLEKLREKLELADKREEELQSLLSVAKEEIAVQKAEITNLKEFPEIDTTQIEDLKSQITNLQVEIENKNSEIATANEKIEKLQVKRERISENKKAAKQIEELNEKLVEAEKRVDKFKKDAEIARKNVVALTNEVESLKSSLQQDEIPSVSIDEDNWMVVMEPETEAEILERRKKEQENERVKSASEEVLDLPFEDPAQMKLWDL